MSFNPVINGLSDSNNTAELQKRIDRPQAAIRPSWRNQERGGKPRPRSAQEQWEHARKRIQELLAGQTPLAPLLSQPKNDSDAQTAKFQRTVSQRLPTPPTREETPFSSSSSSDLENILDPQQNGIKKREIDLPLPLCDSLQSLDFDALYLKHFPDETRPQAQKKSEDSINPLLNFLDVEEEGEEISNKLDFYLDDLGEDNVDWSILAIESAPSNPTDPVKSANSTLPRGFTPNVTQKLS